MDTREQHHLAAELILDGWIKGLQPDARLLEALTHAVLALTAPSAEAKTVEIAPGLLAEVRP